MEEEFSLEMDEKMKNNIKNIIEDSFKENIKNKGSYIKKQLIQMYHEKRWSVILIHVGDHDGYYVNISGPILIYYYKKKCIIIYPRKGEKNPKDEDSKEFNDNSNFVEDIKSLSNEKSNFNEKLKESEIKIKKYESIIKEQKSKIEKIIIEKELLQKNIKEKEEEINNLKNEIQQKHENNSFNKTFYTRDQMIALNFISTDSTLHYAIPCLNKDLFVDVEKKLYDKYPQYKERNNNFLSQGKVVLRFKTIGENHLESGIPIIMQVPYGKK